MPRRSLLTVVLALLLPLPCLAVDAWKAGVAKVSITPDEPMWMSGYASRKKPAEGKETELWAKALVLEDVKGQRVALIALDLVGIPRDLSLDIRAAAKKAHGFDISRIALCTSHTHSGPVVGNNLNAMYFLDEKHQRLVARYVVMLKEKVAQALDEAMKDLKPATIAYGNGTATFAVNRRNNAEKDVPRLREAGQLKGPHDHDVPVLRVTDAAGKVRAIVFGYACHATTLDWMRWSGDYPAYAQKVVEESHGGAVALFWAGCGADQNPIPRRLPELAVKYGEQLAAAVNTIARGEMKMIGGEVKAAYREIDLAFDRVPTKEELTKALASANVYEASRAKMLLAKIESGKGIDATYPYPIQTWRIGDGPVFVLLGGEVVVDFALRFKKEFGPQTTWVAAYVNDVMAYIPSLRVLKEGGYEGAGAMVYYGLPSPWSPAVEEDIAKEVAAQVKAVR